MKKTGVVAALALLMVLISNCGNNEPAETPTSKPVVSEELAEPSSDPGNTEDQSEKQAATDPSQVVVDLEDKGVGVITSVELASAIDQDLAKRGGAIFDAKCSVCHKPDQNFLGPKPQGILERRSPEWVMNMILNPQLMLEKNDIAKALLKQYNGVMMPPTGLTEEEARAVLEYYRTIK